MRSQSIPSATGPAAGPGVRRRWDDGQLNESPEARSGAGRNALAGSLSLEWAARDEIGETPREAAGRRKREAADRNLALLKEKHAEAAQSSHQIAQQLRNSHGR